MESRFKERNQLRGVHRSLHSGGSSVVCDRFIPVRSAMDFDLAYYLLTEPKKVKDNSNPASPWREAYRKCLSQCLLNNRTRILAFKSKPLEPANQFLQDDYSNLVSSCMTTGTLKQQRPVCQSAVRVLDAPDILDDYYLNLLDWGSNNVLAIALENTVFLWDATDKSASELMTVQDDYGPITSVGWSSDGRTIAVGLNSSVVQLWDATSNRLLRTLRGVHHSRVGSLAWSNHCLATGGMDGLVVNNDVRIRNHCIQTYKGHNLDVCGLKWSESGRCLASGGNDNLLHIWDVSMASRSRPPSQNQWLHRLTDHTGAVKALAWCPFQSSLLASGGDGADRCIKFWNAQTGACLKSVDTGSRVSSLLWSKDEKKLLSSHGLDENQLTLWKYSSMTKIAELRGHQSPILFTTQSPDGCLVASAAADETLMFWNVFGNPDVPKRASKTTNTEPFVDHCFIR